MALISLLLALLPLLGIVWMVLHGFLTTVDGLFMSLILLAISGTLGTTALFDLKKRFAGKGTAGGGAPAAKGSDPGSRLVQQGKVGKVDFFESAVGQPNKSIVTLLDGNGPEQFMVFEGDLRNALPTGHKVEITFRRASGYNILLDVQRS
jgi:hypothetical protein